MDTKVITVATHDEGLLKNLINNKFNINITVLGFEKKWTGHRMKLELVLKYIEHLPDDTIIIYLDGFDSTINGRVDTAVELFKKRNDKLLFSKHPDSFYGLDKLVYTAGKDTMILNLGMYMGYVKYLKIVLKEALKLRGSDDQILINKVAKKFNFINIDDKEEIFKNISNLKKIEDEILKSNAVFFSTPGTLSYNRIIRSFKEYGQFFLPYLIIIYLIIVFTLYKFKKLLQISLITILFISYFIVMDKEYIL